MQCGLLIREAIFFSFFSVQRVGRTVPRTVCFLFAARATHTIVFFRSTEEVEDPGNETKPAGEKEHAILRGIYLFTAKHFPFPTYECAIQLSASVSRDTECVWSRGRDTRLRPRKGMAEMPFKEC